MKVKPIFSNIFFIISVHSQILKIYINDTRKNCTNICSGSQVHPFSNFIMGFYEGSKIYQNLATKPTELHFILIGTFFSIFDIDVFNYSQNTPLELLSDIPYNIKINIYPSVCEKSCTNQPTEISLKTDFFTIVIPKFLKIAHILITGNNLRIDPHDIKSNLTEIKKCIYSKIGCCSYGDFRDKTNSLCYFYEFYYKNYINIHKGISFFKFGEFYEKQELLLDNFYLKYAINYIKTNYYYTAFILLPDRESNLININFNKTKFWKNLLPNGIIYGKFLNELNIIEGYHYYYNTYRVSNTLTNLFYSKHFEFSIETIKNAKIENSLLKQSFDASTILTNGGFFNSLKNSNIYLKFSNFLMTEKFFLSATNNTFLIEKCLFEINDRYYPWNNFNEIGIFNFYKNNLFIINDSKFLNDYTNLINPTKYCQYLLHFLSNSYNNSIRIIKMKIENLVNFAIVKSNLNSNSKNYFYFENLEIDIYSTFFEDGAIIYLSNAIVILKNIKIDAKLKTFFESSYNKVYLCDSEIIDKNFLFKSTYSVIIMKNLTFKNQFYHQTTSTFSLGNQIIFFQNYFESLRISPNLFTMEQINDFYFLNNTLKTINIYKEKNLFYFSSTISKKKQYVFFRNNNYENLYHSSYSADFFVFTDYFWVQINNEKIVELKKICLLDFKGTSSFILINNFYIEDIYSYRTTLLSFNEYSTIVFNNSKFEQITNFALARLIFCNYGNNVFMTNLTFSNIIVEELVGSCSGCYGTILKSYYRNFYFFKNIKIENSQMKSIYLNTALIKIYSFNKVKFENITISNVSGIAGVLINFLQSNKIFWKDIFLNKVFMPSVNFFQIETDNQFYLKNVKLVNILSNKGGCAIILDVDNKLLIDNLFVKNISDISRMGGAFLLLERNNSVVVKNVIVSELTVVNQGGFILAKINNFIKVIESFFKNFVDLTNISGGLFSKINSFNTLIIINCEFNNFSEKESGNLVFANEFNVIYFKNLTNFDFQANSINFGGGAVTLIAFNRLLIKNSIFYNVVSFFGSFIFLQTKNIILLENIKLYKNNKANIFSIFKINFENHVFVKDFIVNWSISENNEIKIFELNSNNLLKFSNSQFIFKNNNLFKNYLFFMLYKNSLFLQNVLLKNVKNMKFVDCKNSFVYVENLNLENIEFLEFKLIESTKSKIKIKNLKISIDNLQNNLIYSIDSFCVLEKLFLETKKSKKKIHSNIIYGKNSHFYLKNFNFVSNFYSKNFLELKNSSIQINNCMFGFNNIVYNGAIINFEKFIKSDKKYKNFEIKKSIFLHNSGIEGSNLFLNITNYNEKIIEKNIFIGNKAKKGGIIYSAFFTDIIFTKNKFVNSLADKGGFMYLDRITFESYRKNPFFNYLNSNKTFQNNIFLNQKSIIGGLIFYNTFENFNLNLIQIIIKFSNKIKFNNLIKNIYSKYYGNLFATNPFKIYLESVANLKYFQKSFNIYQKYLKSFENCIFYLKPFDIFGNIAFGTENYFYDLIESNITIKNLLKKNENLLFCLLGNITRSKLDQKEINFFINNYISLYKNKTKIIKNNLKFDKYNIKFIFSGKCQIGERLTDLFSCVPCEKNQYSFNRDFSQISGACHPCDLKFNCFGGFNLTPKAGYSRLSKYSIKFSACPNPTACLGDNRENLNVFDSKYEIGICEKEYKGDFCSECSSGFGKSDLHTCVPCAKSFSYIKISLFILFKLFILLYYGHKSINMAFVVISKENSIDEVISTYLIKILTNHFQIISLITFYQYESPAIIDDIYSFFSVISDSSSKFSFDCILKSLNVDIPSNFFILIIICLELILMIIIGFVYVKFFKKSLLQHYSVTRINTIFCIAIIFLTFSYTQFLNLVSKNFMCINLGDNLIGNNHFFIVIKLNILFNLYYINILGSNYRLINDYSIKCFKGIHLFYIQILVIPIIIGHINILITIVLDINFVSMLKFNKNFLHFLIFCF